MMSIVAVLCGLGVGYMLGTRDSYREWEREFKRANKWFDRYMALIEKVAIKQEPK